MKKILIKSSINDTIRFEKSQWKNKKKHNLSIDLMWFLLYNKVNKKNKECSILKTFKIFTSGKMGGLSNKESLKWRKELENTIKSKKDKKIDVVFINPPEYYDYDYPDQRECEEWEISQLLESDIVVVNLSNIRSSIGTHMEMGIIKAANRLRAKHIYVVGIGEKDVEHPWIDSSVFHRSETVDEAAEFILKKLLI